MIIVVSLSLGEVTLVATGPLTNVAVALKLDPDLGKKLSKCVIMGGNIQGDVCERGYSFMVSVLVY